MTPHTLVVTGHYDIGEQVDERKYAIECPGVTGSCRLWIGCDCPESKAASGDDWDMDDEPVAHGVEHGYIESEWMVPTDRCLYVDPLMMDSLPDVAADLRAPGAVGRGLDAGCYPVIPTWHGEGEFTLDLVEPVPVGASEEDTREIRVHTTPTNGDTHG